MADTPALDTRPTLRRDSVVGRRFCQLLTGLTFRYGRSPVDLSSIRRTSRLTTRLHIYSTRLPASDSPDLTVKRTSADVRGPPGKPVGTDNSTVLFQQPIMGHRLTTRVVRTTLHCTERIRGSATPLRTSPRRQQHASSNESEETCPQSATLRSRSQRWYRG